MMMLDDGQSLQAKMVQKHEPGPIHAQKTHPLKVGQMLLCIKDAKRDHLA
jgi:hypothetical protein